MLAAVRAIEADATLSDREKARKRQEILGGAAQKRAAAEEDDEDHQAALLTHFKCAIFPDKPVSTPCGHNFCLECFKQQVKDRKYRCATCRGPIPPKMIEKPMINTALAAAIRLAMVRKNPKSSGPSNAVHYIRNDHRPETAYRSDRAKKTGKANASSGQIFVTIAPDHFGPILPENDPRRSRGVLVGDTWEDRLECRQWGAHFPHVAGIAGQSKQGAQSVALSGGYIDDEDHGEWFLYTGSGGRDLSGNKRTNNEQSSDQEFTSSNEALRKSCLEGYPVRVVRSYKEKRSSYPPVKGVRYDGVYRIEKCWRKIGVQGTYKVCRYLFVRCDNEPAPWTSDLHGDRPRPLPEISELEVATDLSVREGSASWDYDLKAGRWKWVNTPPISKKRVQTGNPVTDKEIQEYRKRARMSRSDELLKGFACSICKKVLTEPMTTPCAHNFCKTCLLGSYEDKGSMRERSRGGRTLRAQKIVKMCPSCPTDICDFLVNPQVNREMMGLIESLQSEAAEDAKEEAEKSGEGSDVEKSGEESEDALEKEDGDGDSSSQNEEEDDGAAEDKKPEDVDGGEEDASDLKKAVKIVVESKEEAVKKVAAQKRKGGDEEEGKDIKKTKTTVDVPAGAVDSAAEDEVKGAETAENKEEEGAKQVQKKRKGRGAGTAAAGGGGKRKKTSPAAAEEKTTVSASPAASSPADAASTTRPTVRTKAGGGN